MRWQRWLIVAAIPALMLASMAVIIRQGPKEHAKQLGPSETSAPPPARKKAGVLPRQLNERGVSNPEFVDPHDVELAAGDAVIGLVVEGEPRAYLRTALSGVAKRHIVTDATPTGRITVTYCDLAQCARVFVEPADDEPKEIRVGGLQRDETLSLLIDGQRYSQRDPSIPLAEFPFEETSWADWLAKHPQTKIYIGGRTEG